MLIPVIAAIVLLIMARDELNAPWLWGLGAFVVVCFILSVVLINHPFLFIVPIVLVDIFLILKVFGTDITIR